MAKTAKEYRQQVRDFHNEVASAVEGGFEAVLPNGSVMDAARIFSDGGKVIDMDWASTEADTYMKGLNKQESVMCGCGPGTASGLLTSNNPAILSWRQDAYGSTPDGVGGDGKHYVLWGPFNAWPNLIDHAIASNPFLSSIMDYLERTLFGLGPQVMYCITRYSGGTVTHEEVPYRDADVYLKEEIIRIIAKIESLCDDNDENDDDTLRYDNDDLIEAVLGLNPRQPAPMRRKAEWREKLIAKYEKQLAEAENALESYWLSRQKVDTLLESNNLTYFYKRWIYDILRLGICFPMISLSRSGGGHWDTAVVDLDWRDACTMRLEERNPDNLYRIEYAYYSERWRDEANSTPTGNEMVAYPTIMPEHALRDLQQHVRKHHRTKVGERPSWLCCPSYRPTPGKPVYPMMAWWSIFPSMVYQLAVTSLYDKAAARKNSTLWGKILFINTAYLAQVFNQAGDEGKTKEGQQKIRAGIYQSVENFLKDRSNNGKLLVMDSYPSADEKQMIDSVRIVDVPRGDDVKASAQEIAEIASLVSFSFNTNVDLVASRPWSTTSATGTAQRELHLLKNGQLSPDRLTFTDFFNGFIFPFNGIERRFRMTVPYPTLTTLDASKTGIKTVSDGSDA